MAQSEIRLSEPGEKIPGEHVDPKGGDHGVGLISGYRLLTVGPARGHGFSIDSETLSMAHALLSAIPEGIPSRLTHPEMEGFGRDGVTYHLGRTKNFRLDGDTLRGDLHIDPAACMPDGPQGNLGGYVMMRAKTDGSSLGSSLVMRGEAIEVEGAEALSYRPLQILYSDIVGRPAANPALLSEPAQPSEASMTEQEIKALREKAETYERQLSEAKAARETAEQALATERERTAEVQRVAALHDARAKFAAAQSEGKVLKAHREFWLGAYVRRGEGADAVETDEPVRDAKGQPTNAGLAVASLKTFEAWLAKATKIALHEPRGADGVRIDASPGGVQQEYLSEQHRLAQELVGGSDPSSYSTALELASRQIAQSNPDLHRRWRQSLRQEA